MKTFLFCLVMFGSAAHADLFSDRARQVEAREQAEGRAANERILATGQARVHALFERMAASHGGLTNWSPGITIDGGLLLLDYRTNISFETADGLACRPFFQNQYCTDANCSNLRFASVKCIDGNNRELRMDSNGRLSAWGTFQRQKAHRR